MLSLLFLPTEVWLFLSFWRHFREVQSMSRKNKFHSILLSKYFLLLNPDDLKSAPKAFREVVNTVYLIGFLLKLSDLIVMSNLARIHPAIFPGYFQTLISRLQRTLLRSIFSFTRKIFLTENSVKNIRSWPHFDIKSANLELWDSRSPVHSYI